ncbi:molybdopterin-dependent oxidoreductase [Streptomyces sp. LN325]|uniref:molybdopterin-dependent oxidoreductase n=1 Tax=Streptomyces sp. LN325 TaxID=3112976 RepID=UPI00371536D4
MASSPRPRGLLRGQDRAEVDHGQLFLKEYYTLSVIARAGIGTNHLDGNTGNTHLCTATVAEALKETFGCDSRPASCTDIDHADVIVLFGHNMADARPVLWMRVPDRLEGSDPPRLVCVDPRPTAATRRAAVHLAPRAGTNVALPEALLHEIIQTDRIDRDFVEAHTVGFEGLADRVTDTTPAWTARICDVPAGKIADAGDPRRCRTSHGPRHHWILLRPRLRAAVRCSAGSATTLRYTRTQWSTGPTTPRLETGIHKEISTDPARARFPGVITGASRSAHTARVEQEPRITSGL